ncbi:Serine/threonine-protein kinase STE7 [Spathaspora passalidarum NRRL Y-27907]|uniref:Serine/threonine-protein kinase STE7 n=1 Tax=Spathaspora passalidarum (strain NRRL Y-27907 / 11-Y1) TaxID=619300 RepID=G3AHW8_SPAPN|nr:Serine/threonine-protein kinase STE7 [Spathaspora passalidarum NRRL Y-27907]EGW34282.1 Serine/threonine-protein kinase STE7 [Spathaspora passalidarum NRRL Y-27907]
MMNWNNSSDTSLGSSKDKDLPPVPVFSSVTGSTKLDATDDSSELLQAKTLKRKNFKKLSLDASPSKDNARVIDDDSMIRTPISLRQRRQRPAPMLNQALTRNNSMPDSSVELNINKSNRNVDPDQETSADIIINQISNLDLNNKKQGSVTRKRQTVISSISPTKSTSSSPLEPRPASFATALNTIEDQSPIATTGSFELNTKDLVTLKSLGSGHSGTVTKVLHVPTEKIMAKKIIHIDSKSVIQRQIIRELRILHECHSPFIIDFYGAFLNTNNTIVICMEYCNCGSLDKILPLCENKQFPLIVLKKLAFAILSGLSYLYTTHKILHRDIKPNNVLMTHKGEFKLCDFGVSRELTNSMAMADTFVGTSTYMSPERIQGLNYGIKSDVWSMGLMLIELASGIPIWTDDDDDEDKEGEENGNFETRGPEGILDLLQRIVNEPAPTLSNKINPVTKTKYDGKLCQFIDLCLIKDDKSRGSPWQLLEDKNGFLQGVSEGVYDKEHKSWAKKIRKLSKEKNEQEK